MSRRPVRGPAVGLSAGLFAALILGAAGCGSEADDTGSGGGRPATSIDGRGTYRAGSDIRAGVYTAESGCPAGVTTTPDDGLDDDAGGDSFVTMAFQVREYSRVVVKRGQYLHVHGCSHWEWEDPADPRTPDPTTLAGGCEILLGGDRLVEQAVAAVAAGDSSWEAYRLQERLIAVTWALPGQRPLWRLSGDLVDYLDVPSAFATNGVVDPRVRKTAAAIRAACADRG